MLLVDGTDNTGNGLTDIKHFIKNITENLYISENQDRLSVVQFADNTQVSFYLNSHKTKNYNLNAIDILRHK